MCVYVLVVCCMVLELMTGRSSSRGDGGGCIEWSSRVILCVLFCFFVSLVIDSGILL